MNLSPLNKVIPSWGAPTLEGFDTNNVQDGQRMRGLSNRQYVRFYTKKYTEVYATEVKINEKTGNAQVLKTDMRPREREFVQIITPGDKNEVDDFAEDFHKREHWRQYKAFRDGNADPIGTPIDEVTFISQPIATELKYLGCQTLEQLADASDLLIARIGNGWELREFAKQTVKAALDNQSLGQVNALKSELSKAQEIAANQAQQIQELQEQMKSFALLNAQGQVIVSGEVEETPKKKQSQR